MHPVVTFLSLLRARCTAVGTGETSGDRPATGKTLSRTFAVAPSLEGTAFKERSFALTVCRWWLTRRRFYESRSADTITGTGPFVRKIPPHVPRRPAPAPPRYRTGGAMHQGHQESPWHGGGSCRGTAGALLAVPVCHGGQRTGAEHTCGTPAPCALSCGAKR